jgi:capsular exopolysaccharide synthesis family protein
MEYLDDTLGTAEEIALGLSLPTLATIPRPNRLREQQEPASALVEPTSSLAEAYRALVATLAFSSENDRPGANAMPNTLLVTSPSSRGEKARLAGNLAVAMAGAGFRVLLVDADARQPTLHQLFRLTNETGFTSMLAGAAGCEQCVSKTDIPNLSLIPAGPPPETSGLSWPQLPRVIGELRARADVVLFDAPPVLVAADALVLGSQAEGTILAVQSRFTRREAALQATERLCSVRARTVGVVLNRA